MNIRDFGNRYLVNGQFKLLNQSLTFPLSSNSVWIFRNSTLEKVLLRHPWIQRENVLALRSTFTYFCPTGSRDISYLKIFWHFFGLRNSRYWARDIFRVSFPYSRENLIENCWKIKMIFWGGWGNYEAKCLGFSFHCRIFLAHFRMPRSEQPTRLREIFSAWKFFLS